MILTHEDLHRRPELPAEHDRAISAQVSSAITWMAGFWFFISPFTFFGVSGQDSGWNCWIVGGVIMAISLARLAAPFATAQAGLINAALGVWVCVSPWIFGYAHVTTRLTNCLGVGATVIGFSLLSRWDVTVHDAKLDGDFDTSAAHRSHLAV